MKWLLLLLLIALPACERRRKPAEHAPTDSAPTLGPAVPKSDAISERVVIVMEATSDQIQALRSKYSEDDFYVVADDLMWYRASAFEYLEKLKLPVRRIEGRQPLEFMVNGQPRRYAFDEPEIADMLDMLVLYDTNREPRVIATVDLYSINDYFDIPRPDSAQ